MKVSRDLSFQFPAHDDFNLTHYLTSSLTSDSNQPLDPFQKLYHLLLDSNSNEPSESVYAITIGFGLLFGLIILICLSLLAHPFFKKHPSRHLWLVRKCHTAYSTRMSLPFLLLLLLQTSQTDRMHAYGSLSLFIARMPYVVLNGGLSLAICQLMGCIVFELFIIISFLSHRYPDRDYGPYEAFWSVFSFLDLLLIKRLQTQESIDITSFLGPISMNHLNSTLILSKVRSPCGFQVKSFIHHQRPNSQPLENLLTF